MSELSKKAVNWLKKKTESGSGPISTISNARKKREEMYKEFQKGFNN